jgi:hypothetical protein
MTAGTDPPTTRLPTLVAADLSAAELRAGLGRFGDPATLTFYANAVTVTTPGGRRTLDAAITCRAVAGVHSVGLRTADADRLRHACTSPDAQLTLRVDQRLLTLTGPGRQVTIPRW